MDIMEPYGSISNGNIFNINYVFFYLLIVTCVLWLSRARNVVAVKHLPPGPNGFPIIGCTLQLLFSAMKNRQSMHQVLQQLAVKYGPVCYLRLPLGYGIVVISGYTAVHDALTCKELNQRPPSKFEMFHDILKGKGVMFAPNRLWQEHRRFALSVFRRFGVIKQTFEDHIATEADCLKKEIDSLGGHKSFDPFQLLNNAVSNVICSVILGRRFEYDDPKYQNLLHLQHARLSSPLLLMAFIYMPFLAKVPFVPKIALKCMVDLRQTWERIVEEHRTDFDPCDLRDFIDVYIQETESVEEHEAQTNLDIFELYAIIDDLFLAGTDTTGTTLNWTIFYMLLYPDIQERVQEEIDNVVGRNRLPILSDKTHLPYTEAVILEIQRHASVVHITLPRYIQKDVSFRGHILPEGCMILINLFSVTRDASICKDPEVFQPERFLDKQGKVDNFKGQIAFGVGKRACLGEQLARMELFIVFTHLMHRYTFRKPTPDTTMNAKPRAGGVLAPEPYQVLAIPRS
ncbi:cytochrome P450 2J6-like [Amphiura filiformis]|uniref:cytochrome P450 2J6-like n=1 Tax=Amphiura filiformis TaxID=82378 RepID=UPI003B223DE2